MIFLLICRHNLYPLVLLKIKHYHIFYYDFFITKEISNTTYNFVYLNKKKFQTLFKKSDNNLGTDGVQQIHKYTQLPRFCDGPLMDVAHSNIAKKITLLHF
jgi:glycyl-tRNA synthetase alpha subunit